MLCIFGVLCRRWLPAISSDGRKMGSRDKLQDVMSVWPSTGWSEETRTPDIIFVNRAIDRDETFTRGRICTDTNTVYEFQGCIWHVHRCWMTKKHNGVNYVNGKNLHQRTQDKIQYIKDQGYNVV
jgi:hypothetical protein